MNKKLLKIFLIILAICIFFNGKSKKEEVIKVGYMPILVNFPFFAAIEEGFFEEEGLKVKPVELKTSNLNMDALIGGKIDAIASCSSTVHFTIAAKNPDLFKIFLYGVCSTENSVCKVVIRNDSQMKSLADLKGKTIGTFPGSTQMVYCKIALEKYMDPEKDVKIVQLPPPTQIQSLLSGKVDALFTLEPIPTVAELKGLGKILVHDAVATFVQDPYIGGAGSISTKFLKKNPRAAKKFIRAMYKAIDFSRENNKKARMHALKYLTIDKDVALMANISTYWKNNEVQYDALKGMLKIYHDRGILDKIIDPEKIMITGKY